MKTIKAILIFLSVATLLIFNGCGEKIRYVYVKTKCPKLQTFEVNTSKTKHFTIHYKVKEINENTKNSRNSGR